MARKPKNAKKGVVESAVKKSAADTVKPQPQPGSIAAPTPVPMPVPSPGDSTYSPPGTPPETTPPDPSRAEVNQPGNADADEQARDRRQEEGTGKA